MTLLSYNISVHAFGILKPLRQRTETMMSFVQMLSETGCWFGVAMLILYAVLIPLLKIVLLALGTRWRSSNDPEHQKSAARCIGAVQVASKWACPDMFAWILLMYLVRGMGGDAGPHLLSAAKLDIG